MPIPPSMVGRGITHLATLPRNARCAQPPSRNESDLKGTTKKSRNLTMLLASLAASFGAWAATETVGDYTWMYQINGSTAEIMI